MTIPVEFEHHFGYVLAETARLATKRFDQCVRVYGLTRAQCQVLFHLARQEGINQARLADLLDLEPISLARCLDRMEQAGWVERRPDPGDRRARLLYITDKAKPVLDRIFDVASEVRGEALAGLLPAERDGLVALLERVRTNLRGLASIAPVVAAPADTLVAAGGK
jgi:MarR family transcriptional regulator, transcriptional regulator for hemolysin